MEKRIYCLSFLLLGIFACCAQSFTCPGELGWMKFEEKCYKFHAYPRLGKTDAVSSCQRDGANLISINDLAEHQFVDRWLQANDEARQDWMTSGVVRQNGVWWDGDGTTDTTFDMWMNPDGNRFSGSAIIIKYSGTEYMWDVGLATVDYPYICEISLGEVYRIAQEHRDFDYGLNVDNPSLAPRGPKFLKQPENTVILGTTNAFHMDCEASGLPEPRYEWLMENNQGVMQVINVGDNTRLTFTTGRLSVNDPQDSDANTYQCKAINDYGEILSQSVTVTFGSLGNFSNVAPAPVDGIKYQGSQMECPPITGSPAISYGWYKGNFQFIRPNFQKHTFISNNGKLYFSALVPSDQDDYRCMASLSSQGDPGNYLGAFQAPSRISKSFALNVRSGGAFNQAPIIQNEFIFITPGTPMKGSDVSLECFAYGNGELIYSWSRQDKPLPKNKGYTSNNRILTLYDAALEDDGIYTCRVFGTSSGLDDTKSTELLIQSKPYFTYELADQHVDIGSQLTWTCEAEGRPTPVYSWYKNGQILTSSPGVTVNKNHLVINELDPERDNGMYQCGANNRYGTTFSSAQLRVLKLEPSFSKSPMKKSLSSSRGGTVTLLCNPTAAPTPTYTWTKDGQSLDLTIGNFHDEDHLKLLINGNLMIQDVQTSDQGRYTCSVDNGLGTAEDYTVLTTTAKITITTPPADKNVEVNLPVFLTCDASHPSNVDMVYVWKFNDHVINFDREPEFRQGSYTHGYSQGEGDLNIIAVQFKNDGYYTCTASTGLDTTSDRAYVTVRGPPNEPMGVHVLTAPDVGMATDSNNKTNTRWLTWTDTDNIDRPILSYTVEFNTAYDKTWRVLPGSERIPVGETQNENFKDKRYTMVTNLKAGALISFRITSRNNYGLGAPSLPTAEAKIADALPVARVKNIRGGGGSVGDLAIVWDPLPKEDHNGGNFRYIVRWREYTGGSNSDLVKWNEEIVRHDDACKVVPDFKTGLIHICKFVYLVGADFFYMPYEVIITPKNDIGDGTPSEPTVVMSAEELPLTAPTKVYAKQFNATALMVTWDPIPNDRKNARGELKGYKINYWRMNLDTELLALQNIIELPNGATNLREGLIIGLVAFEWYSFNVQAYNSAGNGPKSSDYDQQTYNKAPQNYPTEVHVFSIDGFGVRVNFRGISTQWREEPLLGYVVQYWKSRENILSAQEAHFGKRTTGVIRNLTSSELYQLRVYGYSRGGQGARSSPSIFFTVGDGQLVINQETVQFGNGATFLTLSHVSLFFLTTLASIWAHRLS